MNKQQDVGSGGMASVDRQPDPDEIVQHLDTIRTIDWVQHVKQKTFALLEATSGDRILDVGCGTGEDVQALARVVGDQGRVVGLDNSEMLVTEARNRAKGSDLPVEYYVGDVQNLDFDDGTFNGIRAERVFQHLDDPKQALMEMIRVSRPGARMVILDPDWETWALDVPNRTVTRKILNYAVDTYVRNGWIGRKLFGLFTECGLRDISITPVTHVETDYDLVNKLLRLPMHAERARDAGLVSAEEVAKWLSDLEKAGQDGRFFNAITYFIVTGRKP